MPLPIATYRLQFRNGMDFHAARALIPHLVRLGVSHLYASPVFTAVNGSTHGYDVVDMTEIDPSLGGIAGLEALAADLKRAGLGLILDIVPNHMAASLENEWWRSVVQWGEQSPFSRHFDIDWSRRLTLPFLAKSFAEEVEDGTITLAIDPRRTILALRYHDSFYPLHPKTYGLVLDTAGASLANDILALVANTTLQSITTLEAGIASLLRDAGFKRLDSILGCLSADSSLLSAVHDAQPWELTDWKTASHTLSYRRFFEIAGLAGLRVEDPGVFDDSHRLVLDLVARGVVDGLRIDHIDGLADPKTYLQRLRAAVGSDVYIVVEKILENDETMPGDWPVDGTTGYEFIAALADIFIDRRKGGRLDRTFRELKARPRSFEAERDACKTLMLTENFAGEVARVASVAHRIAMGLGMDIPPSALAAAIRALVSKLSVYRTYATAEGAGEMDRAILASIEQDALEGASGTGTVIAIGFVASLLGHNPRTVSMEDLAELRARFQQLSGPIMAKAIEDTLFYRENSLIAANEVGGNPKTAGAGSAAFHAAMARRQQQTPHGLSATSTHDTKRGEDARARLYVLSEAPGEWIEAVRRWNGMNAGLRQGMSSFQALAPEVEWLIYQSLAGAWPIDGLSDGKAMARLPKRMCHYVEKALREAKQWSNWLSPDRPYEEACTRFVAGLFERPAFLTDFDTTLRPFVQAGLINALSQALIKLTAPGIPDIYQGSEHADFSLVDPDNRGLLDAGACTLPAGSPTHRRNFPAYKQWLMSRFLDFRRQHAENIFGGPYLPLEIGGDQAPYWLGYLRGAPASFAVTIVPRRTLHRIETDRLLMRSDCVADVSIRLPDGYRDRALRNVLGDGSLPAADAIRLAPLLSHHPVLLLASA